MLPALIAIFLCQLIGELVVVALGLPLPGPIVGMLILFAGLLVKKGVPAPLAQVADGLLAHLSLLFVPAGAGIVLHVATLESGAAIIGLSILVPTLCTVAVTGIVMQRLSRRTGSGRS